MAADARQAALTLLAEQEDSAELPLSVRLLADCRIAFRDADALPTADLLQRLLADEEAPWATLGSGGLSPMKLGMLLRNFEIRSGNIRFPTGQAKGYHRHAFANAWNRYCPAPETTTDDTGTAQATQSRSRPCRRQQPHGLRVSKQPRGRTTLTTPTMTVTGCSMCRRRRSCSAPSTAVVSGSRDD